MNDTERTTVDVPHLLKDLSTRSGRALLSQLGLRSEPLRARLQEIYAAPPGDPSGLLADPVVEATFGWAPGDEDMAALAARGLLSGRLVDAMDRAVVDGDDEYRFPNSRLPFRHQLGAWETLCTDPVRSVLVSSGTGSGKTECFLIPILDDLVREKEREGHLTGVRALFLYPLNALINSQRERLRAWTRAFGPDIRFCLYNGQTPERTNAAKRRAHPYEQLAREDLRKDPAPILVTNGTMLEYMLVRTEDREIVQQSTGKLRWVVLDEAHTYVGSQAADVALQLRRVMHAFRVDPKDVRFVATSATIGGEDATESLRAFLADLSGAPTENVVVLTGERRVPELDATFGGDGTPSGDLYAALSRDETAKALRRSLSQGPKTLGELARSTDQPPEGVLDLLQQSARAQVGFDFFLPTRTHVFHRTQSGLWACANPECSGLASTPSLQGWGFGALFHERTETCPHCAHSVFEVVACSNCGQHYQSAGEVDIEASEGEFALEQYLPKEDIDEYGLELDTDDDDLTIEPETQKRLLCPPDLDNDRIQRVRWAGTGPAVNRTGDGRELRLLLPEAGTSDRHTCVRCDETDERGHLFRELRVGAPFVLSTIVPAALDHTPPMRARGKRPHNGRRILGFSDSRQGSARLAVRLQQEAERNHVRSALFHALASARPRAASNEEVEELRKQVEALAGNPVLKALHDEKARELAEKLGGAAQPGQLDWAHLRSKLLGDDNVIWMRGQFERTTHMKLENDEFADFCLFREFFRRPKRMNSAETLGLMRIAYPDVERARAPADWPLETKDWHDLLTSILNFTARGTGAVKMDQRYLRWMGIPIRPHFVKGPDYDGGAENNLTLWPRSRPGKRIGRIAWILHNLTGTDNEDAEGRDHVNALLRDAWKNLRPLFDMVELGFVLDLARVAVLREFRNGWICPHTRRVLDTTINGISPYLPPGTVPEPCPPIAMPVLEFPFWRTEGDATIPYTEREAWLEAQAEACAARKAGVWSDLNDRAVLFAPYFSTGEHSAQLSGQELERFEKLFKNGEMNVLSCSTTMEMGVDIGGLSGVAMNNVPPSPPNYLQRAGRAGRRGEGASFAVTLCPASPHGAHVFVNPRWPFDTEIRAPRVTLDSPRLVQRHVDALCLGEFMRGRDVRRLQSGWFFRADDTGTAPVDEMIAWCRDEAASDTSLVLGTERLVRRTALEARPVPALLNTCASLLEGIAAVWRTDHDAMTAQLREFQGTDESPRTPEARSVEQQLRRMEGEYLLRELVDRKFLPGHGFPSGVVSFIPTTLEELRNRRTGGDPNREESLAGKAGFPSRELATAIRDYTPGAEVVINGRVFESGGVTLNWHLPPGTADVGEVQALSWAWRCRSCGANGSSRSRKDTCPECGSSDLRDEHVLEPAGFAVDLRYRPHNNIVRPTYLPAQDPWLHCTAMDWIPLADPDVGRFRYSDEGHVYHRSIGLHGHGYALCLRCGRAAPEVDPSCTELPPELAGGHSRLRGGRNKDGDSRCDGSDAAHAIQRGLKLGGSRTTDVFELQLEAIRDADTAWGVAIALRRSLARHLGVEEREIGVLAREAVLQDGHRGYSLFLYDAGQGGNGYVAIVGERLRDVLNGCLEVLRCPKDCDAACHACLLTYDTQFMAKELDRHKALAVFDATLMAAVELPDTMKLLGEASRYLSRPLARHVEAVGLQPGTRRMTLWFGGEAADWEPAHFRLRVAFLRWIAEGKAVRLVVEPEAWASLEDGVRQHLGALVATAPERVAVHVEAGPRPPNGLGRLIALAEKDDGCQGWALSGDVSAPPMNELWPQADGAGPAITGHTEALHPNSDPLTESDLAPRPSGTVTAVRIRTELDGPVLAFGERFWATLTAESPALAEAISGGEPLQEIDYRDRYVTSPWAFLLLRLVVCQLTTRAGLVEPMTLWTVRTRSMDLRRQDPRSPSDLGHDWREEAARSRFHEQLADSTLGGSWPGRFRSDHEPRLPHDRRLELRWANATWAIQLDQGFGHWVPRGRDQRFDFDATPREQVAALARSISGLRVGTREAEGTPLFVVRR